MKFTTDKNQQLFFKKNSHLDSSVGIRLQYLRSSIPVIANPFEDMDKQIFPEILSSQAFCTAQIISSAKSKQINFSQPPKDKKKRPI